jgi:hypothetical protein
VLGLAGAAIVVTLREHDHLTGMAALALATLMLLCLPTSEHLSGRVLLTGAAVLGWSQVIWWARLPFDRVSLALGALVGATTALVVWRGTSSAMSLRSLVPRARWVDLVPVTVLLGGVAAKWSALSQARPGGALASFLTGWDNAGHFSMFEMILRRGATVDALPPPRDGGAWNYAYYPEGFHATTASLAQLVWPRASTDLGQLVVAYGRASAIVTVAAVTVLAAGITSLPSMRVRPEVAAPMAVFISGVFFFGLGRSLTGSGFAAFLLPCALAGAAVFVILQWEQVSQVGHAVALGGALVGVAHGWILLLTLPGPALLALAVPLSRDRLRASRGQWVALMVVAAATAYGIWRAVRIVLADPAGGHLTTRGHVLPPDPWLLMALPLVTVLILTAPARSVGSRSEVILRRRVWLTTLMVPAAVAVAAYLASIQVQVLGRTGYYFLKYLCGVELVLFALVTAAVAARLGPRPPRMVTTSRLVSVVVIAALTLSAALVSVATGQDPGRKERLYRQGTAAGSAGIAKNILRASRQLPLGVGGSSYLASPGPMDTMNDALWYLALRGEWSSGAEARARQMFGIRPDMPAIVYLADTWLDKNSGVLVVTPEVRRQLELSPAARGNLDRVVSW